MNEADFQLIEDAIRGQLSTDKDHEFRSRLETDAEFKRHYEETTLMIRSIKSVAAERMIRAEGSRQAPTGKVIAWTSPRVLALAATLLIIAIAGLWMITRRQNDLFDQYYTTYTDLSLNQPRGEQTVYEMKVRALDYYRLHQTALALQVLDSAFALEPGDDEALMLTGLCHLDESSYRKALDAFDKIEAAQGKDPALLWYMALAHLGLGEIDETKKRLKEVEATGSETYAPKAAALARRLSE